MTKSARGLNIVVMTLLCALSGMRNANAQSTDRVVGTTATGRLHGTLRDSMSLQPVAGAVVW
ncbi:MAG: hypothetical protein ABI852_19550, partial [Gemmatimonadaceae bacterium]